MKKSVFVLISTYIASWAAVSLIGGHVVNKNFDKVINTALGLTGTRTEILEEDDVDTEHFKSSYVVKEANGNIKYVTDDDGYTHQQYDDVGLREATTKLAEEVQREGTTLLWNSDTNGLPLASGNKVSLFSHSSIDWCESGGGSGVAQTNSNSNLLNELTGVGIEVNKTLWDFYKTGAGSGSAYTRVGNTAINEVPWSVYTNDVKNSFTSYNDAAIVVLTRTTREASMGQGNGQNGGDATKSLADTPTGDYFDFSLEEETLLDEVIKLKKSGTFKKVIILLNTPTGMFMDTIFKYKEDIDSMIWTGFTGYQGLHEVANIFAGNSIPSGHLADTFPMVTFSSPSAVNVEAIEYTNANTIGLSSVSKQGRYLTYAEGIYVGYKYYETRYEDAVLNRYNATSDSGIGASKNNTWTYKEEVAFPFGYGEAYTDFEFSNFSANKKDDGDYEVKVTVKNIGTKAGKDVAQIYIQKPYTQYDINNGIEEASVNLCGYAKTVMLQPGDSQELTILVRDDAFKTYDANNKKTYIREKTTGNEGYYLTAAFDSHSAINNILAHKGYTVANTSGVMDSDGNSSLVAKFTFEEDDFTTFSVSEKTGNEITNRFDDADWNKYVNKTDANITYLSRKDWKATYPVTTTKLSLNENIVLDLAYNHEFEAKEEDEMPLYNQNTIYNLIDTKGLDYNDPVWDELLNTLSIDEQIELLGSAYFGTIAIPKIGKPADKAGDGPLGLKVAFKYSPSIRTMSYPSPTVLSATFNDELALKVGELMGEDALHSGYTGLYAPGSNTHRSTYGARNWEYHSEDGFLSGIISKYRVIGSQSKGCYVHLKHFAFNDQESFRHGVGVWANEQAIREIYLQAYEYAATEGKASGFMSAFVRIGTHWTGAHKGLCTDIVRGEWGVKGFIVSDSAWQVYMGVIDGVMAGNDCILGKVDLSMYNSAKTNPTIAKAVRESAHRMLYTVANSNAMNGISNSVRIYQVQEWWQYLIANIQSILIAITIAFATITALIFAFEKPIRKEKAKNKLEKTQNNSDNSNKKGPLFKKHKFKLIFTASILGVVLLTSLITPSTMKDLYPDYSSTPVALRDRIEGNPELIKLEMEDSLIETSIATLNKEYGGLTLTETNSPSGSGFISNISDDGTLTMTHYFTSSVSTKAVLGASFGKLDLDVVIGDSYEIRLNGAKVSYKKTAVTLSATSESALVGYDWTEIDFLIVDIEEGLNELTIIKSDGQENYPNIDYAYLYAETEISSVDTLSGDLYTFDCNDNLDPFIEEHGGEIIDEDKTYRTEGSENKYRYGNLNGAQIKTTIVVEEATIATYHVIGDCRPNPLRTFSYNQVSSGDPYISKFSVNNGESRYIPSMKQYESIGWNKYRNEEIAIIELVPGENVIEFTIGGDNINLCGISVRSNIPVKLLGQDAPIIPDPDPDVPGGDDGDDDDPTTTNVVKLEAEDAIIETNIKEFGVGYESRTPEKTNNPSGSGFVYNTNKSGSATFTFNFTSSKAGKVTLGAAFGRREYTLKVSEMYNITINGSNVSVDDITIGKMKEGGVQYYDWFEQDLNTINVIEGNNTIVLTKVANAPKILNLDYIYLKTDANITNSNLNAFTFNTNNASDPSNPQNEANPFATQNGGSYSDSDGDYRSENGSPYRYGNGNNAKLSVTLVSERHASAMFKLIADCRPKTSTGAGASVFSYTQQEITNDRPNPYIASFKVNGSTINFNPSEETYASIGWNKFRDFELAKINLKPGENVIEFTIGGDNINFCGITVDSASNISIANKGAEAETKKYTFNVNDASDPTLEENEMNPFATMNKGSHVDPGDSAGTYKSENGKWKYGNSNGATFTATLVAEKDSVATIYLLNDCRPKTSTGAAASVFSYTQQTQTNDRANPYISSFTLNGTTDDIISTSVRSYSSQGWNVFMECELVKVNLKAGENVIVFTIGGDNINVAGLVIEATSVITLGKN